MVDAVAKATAKMVSGLPEKGASFALDMDVKADVNISEEKGEVRGDIMPELKNLAEKVLETYGYDYGLEIRIETSIPCDAGLGITEASAIATVLGIVGALAKKHGSVDELKIDKYLKEQFMLVEDKLVDKKKLLELCTGIGEYDRLASSLYGGFIVSDNKKKEVMLRGEMETMHAVIAVPYKITEMDPAKMRLYKNELEIIWDEALKGNLYTAMKMNTLLYEGDLSKNMLKAGALTATVSYPSVVGLTRDESKTREIEEAVKNEATTQIKKISNEPAKALTKPRRIVKTKEFLEIKGSQEYHFL